MATADPMSWPEENSGPDPPEDDHPDVVVLLGRAEGVVELDEHAPVLGVAGVGPVEQDADDRALVVLLVLQEFVVRHGPSLSALASSWRSTLAWSIVAEGGRPGRGPPDGRAERYTVAPEGHEAVHPRRHVDGRRAG